MAYTVTDPKAKSKRGKKGDLSLKTVRADFKLAYQAKRDLVKRQREDFLFALGDQWSAEDKKALTDLKIKPFVSNRIQPNIHLLTGLERQNRTEFTAFPIGEEDGVKAEIASALFKDAIRKSGFRYKSSEQFKDGITCGESHLELYLDNSESIINAKPCWRKCDGDSVFPDPSSREYDFSDAKYVYKITLGMEREDLMNLYPEKVKQLESATPKRLDGEFLTDAEGAHRQPKDYPKAGEPSNRDDGSVTDDGFDLVERYYRKWVEQVFIADKKTGQVKPADDKESATAFIAKYQAQIDSDMQAHQQAVADAAIAQYTQGAQPTQPPPPPETDRDRFILLKRRVPEIWCYAYTPGVESALCDERAWFYPKWKTYPIIPFFARFSTAPIKGSDRHLLVQGLVHGAKGSQEKHNKAEMNVMRHLNTSTNSGWIHEEDAWVNPEKVRKFGTAAGVDLEYKKGFAMPQRILPAPLSDGHMKISAESAEAIKAEHGINSDLLAMEQGGTDSGRAILLRQKQGLLMVQEFFDNLSRTREIAGRMLLSQLGEVYDTSTAMQVLGDAFLVKNFPPVTQLDPTDPEKPPQPIMDPETGDPMKYDKEMAQLAVAEVLSGDLGEYHVAVGETVSSDTQRMAVSSELSDMAKMMPNLIPPDLIIKYSTLPESAKNEILAALQAQQAAMAGQNTGMGAQVPPPNPNNARK